MNTNLKKSTIDENYSDDSFLDDEEDEKEEKEKHEKKIEGTAFQRRRPGPPRFLLERRNRAKSEGIRSRKRLTKIKIDPDVFGKPRDFKRIAAPPVDARGKKLDLTARRQYARQKQKLKDRLRTVRSTVSNRLHPAVDRKIRSRKKGRRNSKQRVKSELGILLTDSIHRRRGEEFDKPVLIDVVPVKVPSRDDAESDVINEIILTRPPPLSPTQRRAASASASRRVNETNVRSALLPLVLQLCKVMASYDPDSFGIIHSENLEESLRSVYGAEKVGAASRKWIIRKFADRDGLVDYSEVADWIGGTNSRILEGKSKN